MGLFRRKARGGDVLEPPAPTPEPTPLAVGAPGRCAECGGFGYVDHIDMRSQIQTQHCRECGHAWEFHFDDDGEVLDLTDSAMERRAQTESAPWSASSSESSLR